MKQIVRVVEVVSQVKLNDWKQEGAGAWKEELRNQARPVQDSPQDQACKGRAWQLRPRGDRGQDGAELQGGRVRDLADQ